MEANQINILAFTVLGDLEKIDDSQEPRLARQGWGDIRKTDRLDRIHFDLTFFHSVTFADCDVGTRPYPDAASDVSSTNSVAKAFGERHVEILQRQRARYPLSYAGPCRRRI